LGFRSIASTVTSTHIYPEPTGDPMIGSTKSNGGLDGLTITHSRFDGGHIDFATIISDLYAPVTHSKSSPPSQGTAATLTVGMASGLSISGAPLEHTTLSNVLFAHNVVEGGFAGLYVVGALNAGVVQDALTSNVRIIDNTFPNVPDASVGVVGTEGANGSGSYKGVQQVTIAGNRIIARGWGIGVWGGEAYNDGFDQSNFVRDIEIRDNDITSAGPGVGPASECIDLEGGYVTIGMGVQAGSSVSDVRIERNNVDGLCTDGVLLTGGIGTPKGSVASGNSVHDVVIERNTIRQAATALNIRGGYTMGPDTYVTGNAVQLVSVTSNRFLGNGSPSVGISLTGGLGSTGTVTGNGVKFITFHADLVRGYTAACTSQADAGTLAFGNYLLASCPSPGVGRGHG